MSIPRLELIALYIAYNLADNIKSPLTNYNIKDIHDWTDSTVILHLLKEEEGFKQFVSNRINKINAKAYITWRHVPSNQNPAEDEEYMETKYKSMVDRTNMASTTGTMTSITKHHCK